MNILSKLSIYALVGTVVLSFSSSAFADPVHWEAAIAHLEAAKIEIQKAASGSRDTKQQAIRHINQTIEILKADVEYFKSR